MSLGGDILEATYNHPTLGTGVLYPKANEDSTLDIGGFRSVDDQDMVDGGGRMIDQMNRKRWNADFVISWDMTDADELTKVSELAASPVQAQWTFAHVNGTNWTGKGKPVGDIAGNGNNATFPLKVQGGGQLKQI